MPGTGGGGGGRGAALWNQNVPSYTVRVRRSVGEEDIEKRKQAYRRDSLPTSLGFKRTGSAHEKVTKCCGFPCVPKKRYVEVLIHNTAEFGAGVVADVIR